MTVELMPRLQVSGHVHNLLGPSKLSPNLTYEDARSSRCTTSEIKDDMSAYWTPALYHMTPNNTFVNLDTNGTAVYWFGITGEQETLSEMPGGLREFLLGNPSPVTDRNSHLRLRCRIRHPKRNGRLAQAAYRLCLRRKGGHNGNHSPRLQQAANDC